LDGKRIPLRDDTAKHKKKSNKKGQPRADHKHTYETVLLHTTFKFNLGTSRVAEHRYPTKVCTICGRIGDVDKDLSYYETVIEEVKPWPLHTKKLSKKALSLPKWHADFFDKFAIRDE
jgi:hypothetical protein